MQVQFNPGNHIEGRESLAERAEEVVNDTLARFAEQITRVEVHVSDDNGAKRGPDDKRCTMEARVSGHQPVAVTHHAATLREAINGAAEKLERSLDHTLGRLQRRG
jgi:ribosome-associated translation inhibitor RaiA